MKVLQNQNVIILVLFDDDYDDHLEGDDDDYEYDDDHGYEYDDHHEGGDLLQLRVIEALQGTMDKTNLGQGSQTALCKVMMVMTKMMTMMTKILMMITMMMILWTIIPL